MSDTTDAEPVDPNPTDLIARLRNAAKNEADATSALLEEAAEMLEVMWRDAGIREEATDLVYTWLRQANERASELEAELETYKAGTDQNASENS